MLQLAITGEGIDRLVDLKEGELTIGRSGLNTIVLDDGAISPRHARIIQRGPQTILADLHSDNGTYVNGERLCEPHALTVGDHVQIGYVAIDVRAKTSQLPPPTPPPGPPRFSPRGPDEAALLAQIATNEPGSRDVYADWLDDHGHARDAGFMRAQDELVQLRAKDDKQALEVRQREVGATASRLDYRWRRHVSRSVIERCAREFAFRCPKEWGALAPTDDPGVRFCNGCQKPVYYVASIGEGRERAANNECVALDLAAERRDKDLDAPYGRACPHCHYVAGSYNRQVCARCGTALPAVPMMLGAIAAPPRR